MDASKFTNGIPTPKEYLALVRNEVEELQSKINEMIAQLQKECAVILTATGEGKVSFGVMAEVKDIENNISLIWDNKQPNP